MAFRGPRSRRSLASIAIAALALAASLQPVAAHGSGGSKMVVLLDDPAPLVGVGSRITDAQGGPIRVALTKRGERVRTAGIPIKLSLVGTWGCLSDRVARTGADGVATFDSVVTCEGFGQRLRASVHHAAHWPWKRSASSRPSAPFDVVSASACDPTCVAEAGDADTRARVSAPRGDQVLLAVGGPGLDCDGYAESSETVTFQVTGTSSWTTVRVTLQDPTRAPGDYEVCFGSPGSSFTSASGQAVSPGEVGLLRDCPDSLGVKTDPCVQKRMLEQGAVVVVFTVPPGDPRVRI